MTNQSGATSFDMVDRCDTATGAGDRLQTARPEFLDRCDLHVLGQRARTTFTCRLDAEASAECTSPMSYSLLPAGAHTFEVRAADALGNVSGPATATWTIDLAAPPAPTIDSSPPDPSNSADPSFTFSDSEPGVDFECGLDGAALSACTSPVTYSGLADGGHTFQVRATTGGSSVSAVTSYTWTIDTAAPTTSIGTKPANPSNDPAPTFTFSASEPSTFECKLDGGNFSGCTSGIAYPGLAEGSHTFSVHARDSAVNTGADATYTWTLDTVAPPAPSLDSTPPSSSTSAGASFAFSDAEPGVAFFCRLDGSAYAGCTSPSSFSGLADGAHSFDVKGRDAVGNDSGVTSFTWTIDTTLPVTTISSGPPSLTNQTSAMFGFFASEGGVSECKLDGSSFSLCASPTIYPVLTAGGHTFQVRTTDQAGNVGQPASYTWTIDTTAPMIVLSSPPNGGSSTNLPTFSGTAGTAANDSTTVTVKVYSGPSANGTPVQTLTTTAQAGGAYRSSPAPASRLARIQPARSSSTARETSGSALRTRSRRPTPCSSPPATSPTAACPETRRLRRWSAPSRTLWSRRSATSSTTSARSLRSTTATTRAGGIQEPHAAGPRWSRLHSREPGPRLRHLLRKPARALRRRGQRPGPRLVQLRPGIVARRGRQLFVRHRCVGMQRDDAGAVAAGGSRCERELLPSRHVPQRALQLGCDPRGHS